jgi:ATP-dependent Lhr-like helicase
MVPRDFAGAWPAKAESAELSADERALREYLSTRGASFATDLARGIGLEPSRVRLVVRSLTNRGLVTNDRFDPLRPAAGAMEAALAEAAAVVSGRSRRVRPRRLAAAAPEGRWSLLQSTADDEETLIQGWIGALFDRYGVLVRELLELDPWAPRWADVAPYLARSELRGELRRGYFVEGFSGVQYAEDDVVEELARLAGSGTTSAASADILLAAGDPANLYGTGAPLDIPLLDGGTRRLSRTAGNSLVLSSGRPVLIIEAHGKRLTGLASASTQEIHAALARLLELVRPGRQVLKVETYNGEPASSSAIAPRLAELGFVRDYPGMTFYAAWATAATSIASSASD